jgi:hypothetical protein
MSKEEGTMSLSDYFTHAKGAGVFATADAKGNVGAAVYARPHVIDEETVAFIMADRTSHGNLQSNPHAVYLFMEDGEAYAGKRLYLTKVREESDLEKIQALRRRKVPPVCDPMEGEARYLVFFRVDKTRPLVGDGGTAT